MSDANVLSALDRYSNGYKRSALNNVLIYGRVRCIINKPHFIGNGIQESDGYFAIVDAYALKCLGEDYFREGSSYDINSVYFTKGSILIYIDDKKWVGKDVKVFGKSKSYGATIRRQDCQRKDEGISAFMFGPPINNGRKSVYPLVPNVLVEVNSKDSGVKGTALEDFIIKVASSDVKDIPYPETLDSIIPYTGIENYEEIPVDNLITEETAKSPSKEERVFTSRKDTMGVDTQVSNGDRIDISKIDMKLTFHLDGQPQSEFFGAFKEDISVNASARKKFVDDALRSLGRYLSGSDYCDLKQKFVERVAANPYKRVGAYSVTCKKYIDTFIENCDTDVIGVNSSSDSMSRRSEIEKLKREVSVNPKALSGINDLKALQLPILSPKGESVLTYVVNAIGVCTGIGFSALYKNANYCVNRLNIQGSAWVNMLLKCPYVLGLLGVGLSVVDCDILYLSIGRLFDDNRLTETNIKYRSYLIMLDTLKNCSEGKYRRIDKMGKGINTFVKISDYITADCCYPSKAITNAKNTGFLGSLENKDLLELWLGIDITMASDDVTVIMSDDWYSQECFDELCEAGIINTLDGYCALERAIEQEFLIYEVFEKMGKMSTGITDDTIENVISAFEKDRGFKLEGLQREGIKLCKYRAGVLSGCAGSGKTTTSDCMTEVLKTLGTDEDIKIIYCTPTGKACRRLAEVVHSTVKTIHSQFGVNVGGSSYLQGAYRVKQGNNNSNGEAVKPIIYILDEMAMCSTDLMYSIAKNITDNDMIYFLGDVKQLPPIGGGCPFKILMQVLPCVELGVSKRAAEGSLVNYNTSLINFMSVPYCQELLYDDKTFIAKDCADISIANETRNVFAGFMDGSLTGEIYAEDDIQVISGYQSNKKLSSTSRLNKPLQSLLRKDDKVLYYKEVRTVGEENEPFYKNDRVIYINRNSYDICRYVYEDGIFHQVATFGCVNGEMGKMVGVIRSNNTVIKELGSLSDLVAGEGFYSNVSEEELVSIVERYESRKDDMRNDTNFEDDNAYFVVVRVYDTDLRRNVYVLLRGRGRYVGADFCLSGVDLDNLALAYALTCHKMQGSQSKVVVAVFESTGSPDFMNRNMINTIITRSQGIVCCVGSVLGEESMLNKGRLKVSKTDCRDVLAVMSGNVGWLEA